MFLHSQFFLDCQASRFTCVPAKRSVSGTKAHINYNILSCQSEFDWAASAGLPWFCPSAVRLCSIYFRCYRFARRTFNFELKSLNAARSSSWGESGPRLVVIRLHVVPTATERTSALAENSRCNSACEWELKCVCVCSSVCWPSERTWQTTGTTLGQEHYLLSSQHHVVPCVSRWPRTVITSPRSPSWVLRWWRARVTLIWIFQCGSPVLLRRPLPGSRAGTLSLSCARGQSP